jgi:hypothetical protein
MAAFIIDFLEHNDLKEHFENEEQVLILHSTILLLIEI